MFVWLLQAKITMVILLASHVNMARPKLQAVADLAQWARVGPTMKMLIKFIYIFIKLDN